MFAYAINFLQDKEIIDKLEKERAIRKIGFLGYVIGLFTLFISLKIENMTSGSIFSFLFFFSLIIMLNYLESALTSLFMDMIGYRASASSLFYLYGISEFLWLASLPFAYLAKLSIISFPLSISLILICIFLTRLKMIKNLYSVRYKLALISFIAPYVIMYFITIVGSVYFIYSIFSLI